MLLMFWCSRRLPKPKVLSVMSWVKVYINVVNVMVLMLPASTQGVVSKDLGKGLHLDKNTVRSG